MDTLKSQTDILFTSQLVLAKLNNNPVLILLASFTHRHCEVRSNLKTLAINIVHSDCFVLRNVGCEINVIRADPDFSSGEVNSRTDIN